MQKIADVPRSAGELASIAPTKGLPSMVSGGCIVRPPGFPGLELAVPSDAAAGIETLVEHALGDTVAGIEHLPTPDSLNAETVFGPSYSRLAKTGLDDAGCRAVARWGGAVFFVSNHLADARDRLGWFTDDVRAAERRKAKDVVDTRLASRLAGRWGGAEPAQRLRRQIYLRDAEPPKPSQDKRGARLAVATRPAGFPAAPQSVWRPSWTPADGARLPRWDRCCLRFPGPRRPTGGRGWTGSPTRPSVAW
jgi:hypothetical protein